MLTPSIYPLKSVKTHLMQATHFARVHPSAIKLSDTRKPLSAGSGDGVRDRPTSPRSPWQNPYAERLIGTLRRDCLITLSSSARGICIGS